MIYQHIHSTQLGSKRQAIHYLNDGSGRDTYIGINNGGTNIPNTTQTIPKGGNYMKFGPVKSTFNPVVYTRHHKYLSDGTGRDVYVISGHGGQFNEQVQNSVLLIKYRQTMRDGGWKKVQKTCVGDFYQTKSEIQSAQKIKKTQGGITLRLSKPKKKLQNYLHKLANLKKSIHQ